MNGPWDVSSDCTPDCAAHAVPRVPATVVARRGAVFAHTVRRALTDGTRLADPVRLRGHAAALLDALGIRVEGAAALTAGDGPGTLVVANHISWLDILALLAVEPVTLLAKREVGGWPVVGGLARRAGTHFIDRTHPRRLPDSVRQVAELLRSGRSVAVFPQATTWCTTEQGAFRRATFQAALDAGAPVRPVTLDYTQQGLPSTVAAFCGEDTFAGSLRRVLAARGLTIRVTAHAALTAADGDLDRRELAARAARAVRGGQLSLSPASAAVAGAAVRRASAAAAPALSAPVPSAPAPSVPAPGTAASSPSPRIPSAPAPVPPHSPLPDTPLRDTPAHV
ncbi:lysophospholipid acyltransferase family protein [Streptomyces sioyaensis]|uniref:1-acyl-sn-glycerol-3-phosphate acyltransferase n=1 Tax=Streptomyces sioyaensis TaxID=67364 RepID=A0A4Q1QV97_9ACTN|nr:lysophospholipid acyltransferase family protein [Streptomyces sioyaensis]RXS57921.1 1-acyl-sn-glycerol-3-phosphate acyltransferase [Streptomyces sioyaensis]